MKAAPPILKPRSKREQAKTHSLVDVTLDAAQKRLVELPPAGTLLVLGEAGYGKTTVASRRALYVAATRARHQLVVTASGEISPVLAHLSTADEIVFVRT